MNKDFSIREAVKFGWNTMKSNFWFFLGILIVAWVIVAIPSGIATLLQKQSPGFVFLFNIITWVVQLIVAIGFIRIALRFVDNEKAEFNDLFSFPPYFWRYLGGSILYFLIVAGGMILLIIPGIIWAIKFQYYGYGIIDQNLDPVDALKKSSAITNGIKWELFGFGIVLALINILGALVFFVGLFATVPTTLVAYAFVYRRLLQQTEAIQAQTPQPAT
ncbi:MAG: hypothetical protein JSV97_11195 [candidate division WOR-3 bacterium]|nr:MAG: hypothetical protein JSV97_11195 [candidate division WOR-3 bacterium]